jgi:hypothetical protein
MSIEFQTVRRLEAENFSKVVRSSTEIENIS